MVVLYRPWTLMVGCPSGESGDEGGVGVVPVGGEVVEGGLNVDGLPQHKDVDLIPSVSSWFSCPT